ncbi:g10882 [Coccomyxa viridis]|uniref:G10882 protein n=1 Tax=Coccomyxa viridis TaxID=1274662 RepID=A0ABP1G984_9CHLO
MPASTCSVVVRVRPTDDGNRNHIQTVKNDQGTSVLIRKASGDDGMYKECARDVVNSVLEGFNGTIMAYGQTGSGKTFTMSGPQSRTVASGKWGIMPRAISQVFKQLQVGEYLQWTVETSYVELYNESFRDLADTSTAPADISIFEQQ